MKYRRCKKFLELQLRVWFFGCSTIQFCGYTPCAKKGGFFVETFLASLGVGIVKLRVSLFISSVLAKDLPAHESTGLPSVAVGLLAYTTLKKMPSAHLVQMDLQERFPADNTSPVLCEAAG